MATPLLTTKLYIPPVRPELVSRPRLIEQLNAGLHRKFTLISAPAGFGKTTLLSEWVQQSERPTAWLSLDEGDNDPVRFWTYFITALQTVQTDIGESALAALESPQPPSFESVLTALINELTVAPQGDHQGRPYMLILDDYHLIEVQPIHQALTFLLDHLPPPSVGLHLVIASRTDPPLPLPRLRARDQLTELRAADLRFTPDETAAFLNQVMNLGLSANDVATLEARTEGWIAGLQLAALSMQGRADVSEFITSFTGSNRYVLDYLVEEVLRRQPEDVQRFLLHTSILDRMTGSLCDALTGRADGQTMLEMLEQANLFIVPLDQDRTWYRYHRLFAEFLRSRLRQPPPLPLSLTAEIKEEMSDLHCRASEWYERHGLLAEAVKHALDARDVERAARLIEQAVRQTLMRGEASTLLGWLEALPNRVIRSRPYLCLAHAWALVIAGQPDAAEQCAQEAIQAASAGEAEIQGEAAAVRTLIAALRSDVPCTIEFAHQALEHLPADDLFLRGLVALNLGLAYDMHGNMTAASQAYSEAKAIGQAAGNTLVSLMAITQLADLKVLQGKLHEAADMYQQAIRLATEPGKQLPVAGMAYAAMGRLLYERNDLDAATRCLTTCVELGQQWEIPDILVAGSVYLAQVRQAQGDEDSARDLIQQAEQAMQGHIISPPTVGVAKAYQARLWVRQGNTEAAARWAQDYQARPSDVPSYLRQIEGTTWARVLMAQGKPEAVTSLLDPLLQAAEAAGQTGNMVELLTLQALALEAQGESAQAITTFHRTLMLAEPEGYVRIFIDEGTPMRELMRQAAARGIAADYVGKLLAALEKETKDERRTTKPLPSSLVPSTSSGQALGPSSSLVEPLSERELEVLRLLTTHLSSTEIADELVISANTVRSHIKSIYSKLNVHSRMDAVQRARELELL